jgi:hypothetical protein
MEHQWRLWQRRTREKNQHSEINEHMPGENWALKSYHNKQEALQGIILKSPEAETPNRVLSIFNCNLDSLRNSIKFSGKTSH